ncbi:MAG: hypothetical protein ACK5H2_12395 [Beutenbergiaceae bacterium]
MSALVTQPARPAQPQAQQQPNGPSGGGFASARRITVISITAVVVCLLVAIGGFIAAQRQAAGMDRAVQNTGRVLDVMNLGIALLEADGAATNAFLVGGLEPVERRAVYDESIAEAATLLAGLAEGAESDSERLAALNVNLVTYTGLVEAARVNNRLGFPVGSAYLDQASTLMREVMLKQVDGLLETAADEAAGDFSASNWVFGLLAVLAVAVVALVWCQYQLASITKRRLNRGLVLASALLIIAFITTQVAAVGAANAVNDARTEVYRPTLAVAQATVLASQARSLESFTLIKRGSGQAYEEEFQELTAEAAQVLPASHHQLAPLLSDWVSGHNEIRALDDAGDWDGAVELAVSTAPDSPSVAFEVFIGQATDAIVEESDTLSRTLADGAWSASLTAWSLAVLGLLAVVVGWRGLAVRREEYR